MKREVDITSKVFGNLTAIQKIDRTFWKFMCSCGNVSIKRKGNVVGGGTTSCGCKLRTLPRTKSGASYFGTKTYRCWANMLSRCRNKNYFRYKDYGGRGITVCERWVKFENFLDDMGDAPKKLSLDRIDNSKGYSKENCRWATTKTQARNNRANVHITYMGKDYLLTDLSKEIGVSIDTIKRRVSLGLPVNQRVKRIFERNNLDLTSFSFTKNRDNDMLRLREKGCTLRQIGSVFGVSRERVRQILDES